MKRILLSVAMIGVASVSIFQATSAALEETVKVAGTSFTVGTSSGGGGGGSEPGNTALRMLGDVSGSASGANLVDSIQGPDFDNITSEWTDEVLVKLHNSGTGVMDLVSDADYISDPETLRDDIYIEILGWNDIDNDGVFDEGEAGVSYGRDTILRLRNDTFILGSINSGETRGFVLRFDGTGVTETNFGHAAVYDFKITGVEQL